MPIQQAKSQQSPFCVQVELTEGCNLRCPFCGINGIRNKSHQYNYMSVEIAQCIADRILEDGWTSRLEFAMHGEPSLNPNLVEIMQLFRETLPGTHIMMTSNGAGFIGKNTSKKIDSVLECANVLALEDYAHAHILGKILKNYDGEHHPTFYPEQKSGNPHRKRKLNEHDLVIIKDISAATNGTHSTLNNHAGSGSPPNSKAEGKRCAKPFRELSIRWDGNIAICCNDWRGLYQVGNVLDETLEDIWQLPAFNAARKKLYHGQRDFGPCNGCDAISYRSGLLPDQYGKLRMAKPNAQDLEIIEQALEGGSYANPVLRSWEK